MEKASPSFIILMADDDEDDCMLVEAAFQEIGFDCDLRFVADGRELLDYLHNEGDFADPKKYPKPNLIFLDLNMPRIDGRQALTVLKSDPLLEKIPIIILSTSEEERDIALTRQAGASSFLTKPGSFQGLIDMLERCCLAVLHNPNIPFRVNAC